MLNPGSAFRSARKACIVINLLVLIGSFFFTQAEVVKASSDEESQYSLSADADKDCLRPLQIPDEGPVQRFPSPPARSLWRARADHRASFPDAGCREPSVEANYSDDDEAATSARNQCLLKRGSRRPVLGLLALVVLLLTMGQFDLLHVAEPPLTEIPSLGHDDAVLVMPSLAAASSNVRHLLQPVNATSESLALQVPSQFLELMRDKYSCLEGAVDTTSSFFPDLFNLISMLDVEFRAHNLSYFITDGSLLGVARHNNGIIPWDDDIDVSLLCAGPEEPCWFQLMDESSPFRKALRRRGLGMWINSPEPNRHLLKVFYDHSHVKDEHAAFTYPFVDIFLLAPVRCNASDSLNADTWSTGKKLPVGSVERLEFEKSLRLYETSIWAYRTDGSRFPPPGPCSVADYLIDHFLPTEVLPMQRVKLGAVEVNAPAKIDQILTRFFGKWRTHIHRSSLGHVPAALRMKRKKPFEPCHVDLNNMSDEERAWISRGIK